MIDRIPATACWQQLVTTCVGRHHPVISHQFTSQSVFGTLPPIRLGVRFRPLKPCVCFAHCARSRFCAAVVTRYSHAVYEQTQDAQNRLIPPDFDLRGAKPLPRLNRRNSL